MKSIIIGFKDLDTHYMNRAKYCQCALDHFLSPAHEYDNKFMVDRSRGQFIEVNGACNVWALNRDQVPPEEQAKAQNQFRTAWQNAKRAQVAVELLTVFFKNL